MRSLSYQPHIDGLRAIAVLGVIFFHFDIAFPGGFVGVDVFFVISGYLIISIITKKLNDGSFQFKDFWKKRILRIAPASLTMMAVTACVGYNVLLPDHLRELGQAILAQIVFLGNVYHFREASYFGPSAEYQPLLHTWSLAIEEQFYLVFPLFLGLAYSCLRKWISLLIACGFLISLIFCVYATQETPRSAFFLIQYRGWELLLGGLLATTQSHIALKNVWAELLAIVGIVLIAACFMFYSQATRFPGISALLPCVGAAFIILADRSKSTLIGRLLSLKLLTGIGLLSYSLYLWHWPIITIARHLSIETHNALIKALLVLATFTISWASYRFIEKPIRTQGQKWQLKTILAGYLGVSILLGIVGFWFHHEKGCPERLSEEALSILAANSSPGIEPVLDPVEIDKDRVITICKASKPDRPTVFIYGDSFVPMYFPAFSEIGSALNVEVKALFAPGNAPFFDAWSRRSFIAGKRMLPFKNSVRKYIERNTPDIVIIVARWDQFINEKSLSGNPIYWIVDEHSKGNNLPETRRVFERQLKNMIDFISACGSEVFIVHSVPSPGFSVPEIIAKSHFLGLNYKSKLKSKENILVEQSYCRTIFSKFITFVNFIDPLPLMLDKENRIKVIDANQALYRDSSHLSQAGALRITPLLLENIRNSLSK